MRRQALALPGLQAGFVFPDNAYRVILIRRHTQQSWRERPALGQNHHQLTFGHKQAVIIGAHAPDPVGHDGDVPGALLQSVCTDIALRFVPCRQQAAAANGPATDESVFPDRAGIPAVRGDGPRSDMRAAMRLAADALAVVAGGRAGVVPRVAVNPHGFACNVKGTGKVIRDHPAPARRGLDEPVQCQPPSLGHAEHRCAAQKEHALVPVVADRAPFARHVVALVTVIEDPVIPDNHALFEVAALPRLDQRGAHEPEQILVYVNTHHPVVVPHHRAHPVRADLEVVALLRDCLGGRLIVQEVRVIGSGQNVVGHQCPAPVDGDARAELRHVEPVLSESAFRLGTAAGVIVVQYRAALDHASEHQPPPGARHAGPAAGHARRAQEWIARMCSVGFTLLPLLLDIGAFPALCRGPFLSPDQVRTKVHHAAHQVNPRDPDVAHRCRALASIRGEADQVPVTRDFVPAFLLHPEHEPRAEAQLAGSCSQWSADRPFPANDDPGFQHQPAAFRAVKGTFAEIVRPGRVVQYTTAPLGQFVTRVLESLEVGPALSVGRHIDDLRPPNVVRPRRVAFLPAVERRHGIVHGCSTRPPKCDGQEQDASA